LKWRRFFKSPAFFVLLALGILNALGGLAFADPSVSDYTVLPVTNLMILTLNGAFSIIPLIVAIYYAGRAGSGASANRHTHEVFDACPVPGLGPSSCRRSRQSHWS